MPNIKCPTCNKVFHVKPSRVKDRKFCSYKCKGIWLSENKKQENSNFWKGGKTKTICENCRKEFHQYKIFKSRFCSFRCKGLWQSEHCKGENSSGWKGGKLKIICPICSITFYAHKSDHRQFCSDKCLKIWRSQNLINDKSCNWKGGITPVVLKIRKCFKYQEWRQKIFIRDDFTCQDCKQEGGELEAHHCNKSFAELIQEVKHNLSLLDLYEAVMIYTPFWEVDNGETLCKKCHDKTKRKIKNIKDSK